MPTSSTFQSVETGAQIVASIAAPRVGRSVAYFQTTAATNLTTYYRMQGWDVLGGAWVTWTVAGTPDPTAARHPSPSSVAVNGAFIIDRFLA